MEQWMNDNLLRGACEAVFETEGASIDFGSRGEPPEFFSFLLLTSSRSLEA
jgi:hypothetical protein